MFKRTPESHFRVIEKFSKDVLQKRGKKKKNKKESPVGGGIYTLNQNNWSLFRLNTLQEDVESAKELHRQKLLCRILDVSSNCLLIFCNIS